MLFTLQRHGFGVSLLRRRARAFRRFATDLSGGRAETAAPPSPQAIGKALVDLEATRSLSRKPWLLLERHRRALEQHFEVETGTLLLGLHRWAEVAAGGLPTATGIANVSGNVYFACDLTVRPSASEPPLVHLSAVQGLIANLFSHSEIGLDAIVSRDERPSERDLALIKELYTFPELRWLHSNLTEDELELLANTRKDESEPRAPKEVVLTTSGRWEIKKRKSLGKYPKVLHLFGLTKETTVVGDCMRHDGYVHQEVEGECLDEWQISFAQGAAKKAYGAGGDVPSAGCSALSSQGKLYAGSMIGAREQGGASSVTPIQCAMVSMAANGMRLDDVTKVVWVADESQASGTLCTAEAELLKRLAPNAEFVQAPLKATV